MQEETEKKEKELLEELLKEARELAHLENIILDDHGDTILGSRLSAPNFSAPNFEKKPL